jgi:hypothetical protein
MTHTLPNVFQILSAIPPTLLEIDEIPLNHINFQPTANFTSCHIKIKTTNDNNISFKDLAHCFTENSIIHEVSSVEVIFGTTSVLLEELGLSLTDTHCQTKDSGELENNH